MKIIKPLICATLVNGMGISVALAQESADQTSQTEIDVDAGVSLTLNYTDNVFLTSNDKRGDWVTVFVPWVDATVSARDYQLSFGAEAQIARFNEYSGENYDDFTLYAEGRYRLNETLFTFGGLSYAREHEDRNSPDDRNGLEPTKLRDINGYFGIGGTRRDNGYRLGVNITDLDFDDTPAPGGATINNDDRDRQEYEIGGRLGVAQWAQGEVFVQGIVNQREYDSVLDDAGRARSSKGFEAALGYTGAIGNLTGEVSVGVLSQNYDDAGFETVTVPDIGAELVWQPSRTTRVTATIDRTIEESTITGASGYVSTATGVRLRYRAAQDLSLAGYFFLTGNDYNGIDRKDTIAEAGAELRYFINPKLYVDTGYAFEQRLSDVAGAEYSEHRIYFSFGTDLQPNYDPQPVPRTRLDQGGFYAGIQMGYGILQSTVDGPRGGGGSLTADFGDRGALAGVFGGYRTSVGSLMLGAEVDIEFSNQSWTHVGGRTFSVETGNTIGVSALIGHMTPARNLIYGRFGVFGTEFESSYQRRGIAASIDETKKGFSVGVGTEVPLGRGLSARMEYQIRNFSDYNLGAPLGGGDDDNFANLQGVARFGLLYTLGAGDDTLPDVEPVDFSGAYAGAMLGHATLQSINTGPRPNAAAPAFILDVIRSGQGFTGSVLGGYGWQRGNTYWGIEAEAEGSGASWNIERDPTGRIYSVDKVGAFNAMLRVGQVLNDNVLLYGRAGISVARFETDYSFAGATVDQNDTLSGLRVGVGVEYALQPDVHLRMDYSYTDYGSHTVDYGAGVDSFDTSESLFQVGLTYQF